MECFKEVPFTYRTPYQASFGLESFSPTVKRTTVHSRHDTTRTLLISKHNLQIITKTNSITQAKNQNSTRHRLSDTAAKFGVSASCLCCPATIGCFISGSRPRSHANVPPIAVGNCVRVVATITGNYNHNRPQSGHSGIYMYKTRSSHSERPV